MRRILAAPLVLLGLLACGRPEAAPAAAANPSSAKQAPAAQVVLRFLDQDAVLPLEAPPSHAPGWAYMDAGAWSPLELRWTPGPPPQGLGAVGRTAPDWVLLKDPEGEVHRIVVKGPGPDELRERGERMDPEDRDELVLLGIGWVFVLRDILR